VAEAGFGIAGVEDDGGRAEERTTTRGLFENSEGLNENIRIAIRGLYVNLRGNMKIIQIGGI
jgi:hypothetical protein